MFDYLQKFNNLPADLRTEISSPAIMSLISDLEKKYQVDLAIAVMKVMTKSLAIKDLSSYFVKEFNLSPAVAADLIRELKTKIFVVVANYLGLGAELKALDLDKDINSFIKEAGIVLPSSVLVKRFKNIIEIYLKGIRNKIDTRNSLAKNIKIGGLNLSEAEIERVLKICDNKKLVNSSKTADSLSTNSVAKKLSPTSTIPVPEYNLKQAIKSGEIKKRSKSEKVEPLEISAPDKQLDLPLEKSILEISSSSEQASLSSEETSEKISSERAPLSSENIPQESSKDGHLVKDSFQDEQSSESAFKEDQPAVTNKLKFSKKNDQSAIINESGLSLAPLKTQIPPTTSKDSKSSSQISPASRAFKKVSFWSKLSFSRKKSKKKDKDNELLSKTSSLATHPAKPSLSDHPVKSSLSDHPVKSSLSDHPVKPSSPVPSAQVLKDGSKLGLAIKPSSATKSGLAPEVTMATKANLATKASLVPEANTSKVNISKPIIESSKPTPPTIKVVPTRSAPTPSITRPAMQDIKAMPKIMGPIEELKFLDIVNFRRLAKDPAEATAKILTKIKLLEEDGYDKMVAGVLAWRQSPINRSYLRLGQEALNNNMTLKAYLDSLVNNGKEQLNFAEIEALVNLNSKLAF